MKARTKTAYKLPRFEFSANFFQINNLKNQKLPPIKGTPFSLEQRRPRPKPQKRPMVHSASAHPARKAAPTTEIYAAENS